MRRKHVGVGLHPDSIRNIVRFYGSRIGVPALAPHDLRRTYARLARQGGAALETVQASLGHSSIATTERYLQSTNAANAGDFIDIDIDKEGEGI
jgi:integrase